ncbi:MAG TPA: T9SS type A sorting domain-containing protein [Flavobacteriales bacterium]|nr:T9SS type A sorting domain-containing protein [Flavobacteriales bacterium]
MKKLLYCILFFSCFSAFGQGRLVLNNDAFVVIDNGAFVVLDNSATTAITQLGTGGRIVSESENDRVKWNIGTTTGTYTMPFSTAAGVEFPMSVTISGGAAGAGNLTFSTYRGGTWDNNTYRPSDVTHMLDYATGSVNNSNNVIDRFWIVDPLGYGTKPNATFDITYIDGEWMTAGNTIVESDLGAQRFNTPSGIWGDYLPAGIINTATNIVGSIPVSSANFFRSWTLSEMSNPLPIELVGYTLNCEANQVNVNWSTAAELNIAKFIISGSNNGADFVALKEVLPVSTGGITSYSELVTNQYLYYSLTTVETNGTTTIEAVSTISCQQGSSATAFVSNGNIIADLTLMAEDDVAFTLYDAAGQLIAKQSLAVAENRSLTDLGKLSLSTGIYFLKIESVTNKLVQTVKLYYH